MNFNEMRELPPTELKSEIAKARKDLWKLRFQARGEPMENPGAVRALKRDVARMLTALNDMKRAGVSTESGGDGPGGNDAGSAAAAEANGSSES